MNKKEYADLGHFCSCCNRKILSPEIYRVRIQNSDVSYEFKSEICKSCFTLVIALLKGAVSNPYESENNN